MARFLAAGFLPLFNVVSAAKEKVNDWGATSVRWVDLTEGKNQAKRLNKPLMVVIHKKGCPACTDLKRGFAHGTKMSLMTHDFVMVNVDVRQAPKETGFHPDGRYFPRVLFWFPDGTPMADIMAGEGKFKYAYDDNTKLYHNMKKARKLAKEVREKGPASR